MKHVPLAAPLTGDVAPRERMVEIHFRVPAVTFRELRRLAQDYDSFGSFMRHIVHAWLRTHPAPIAPDAKYRGTVEASRIEGGRVS